MGYGPPPYGPPNYGPPPPPPGPDYGYGGGQPPASQGSAIGALVANVIGLCACWLVSIIGIVLAIIALTQIQTNPDTARTLTIFAWLSFAVSAIVGIVVFFMYGSAIYYDFLVNDYDSTY